MTIITPINEVPLPIPAAAGIGISLRLMTDADLAFTAHVYASTRQEELAPTGWPQAMIDAFLAQQHAAQHAHYTTHYAGLARYAIQQDGVDIGRLYLHDGNSELRVVDIALLPEARGRGIGGALLTDVLAYARAHGRLTSIHVEQNNPARRLYLRLGFEFEETANAIYDLLICRPAPAPAAQ